MKEQLKSKIDASMGSSALNDVLEELSSATRVLSWSMEEVLDLLGQFRAWWQDNKHRLNQRMQTPFGSIADEARRTTWRIVDALSEVIAQQSAELGNELEASLSDFLSDLGAHEIPTMRLEVATLTEAGDGREQLINRVAAAMLEVEHHDVLDALIAARMIANAVAEQESQDGFAQVGTMMVRGVEWRHRPALPDRLGVIAGMVREHSWFLSSEREVGLLRGLEYLADESATPVKGNDGDGVISVRASAASLAFEMFKHYRKLEKEQPETIRRWQSICCDPNEFAEMKNAWMEAGG